jgi:vitamin B12 transporter
MKYLLVFFILLPNALLAQRKDSVLRRVEVYGIPVERFRIGSQIHIIDSSLLKADQSASVSDVLALQLPVYFRNYGNGMISGISLRGTSPQHTAVLWNGININSFSLGQADFSILPANAFGEITIHEGGGSAQFGSGAFGGAVLLNSSTNDPAQNRFAVTQQLASFSKASTSIQNEISLKRLSLATKLYSVESENNFPVRNLGRQPHASFRQRGLLQDLEYFFSASKSIALHYWAHEVEREVQPSIGQSQSDDEQEDLNHRLNLEFKNNSIFGYTRTNAGYVKDVITFNKDKSEVSRFVLKTAHQYKINEHLQTELAAEWNQITTNIEEYGRDIGEHRFDLFAGLVFQPNEKLSSSISVRKPFVEGFNAPLLPYVGANYKIFDRESDLTISANASINYRVPTLNDRYWHDAGSLDLDPEKSKSVEGSVVWKFHAFSLRSTVYKQLIDQWIQWVPDDRGSYRPRNVKQVSIEGLQTQLTSEHKFDVLSMSVNVHYQYVQSVVTAAPPAEQYAIGKQLIYTPLHTGILSLRVSRRQLFFQPCLQYSSKRYTDPANTDLYALDATLLTNVVAGYYWEIEKHTLGLDFTLKNISDQRYQLYAGRAMPGRNYSIQLTYKLNYTTK